MNRGETTSGVSGFALRSHLPQDVNHVFWDCDLGEVPSVQALEELQEINDGYVPAGSWSDSD